jgi:hypothetical protein
MIEYVDLSLASTPQMVCKNPLAASLCQRIDLEIDTLVGRGDTGIFVGGGGALVLIVGLASKLHRAVWGKACIDRLKGW